MLNKNTDYSKDKIIGELMDKHDKKNDTILTTMKGDFYGKVVAVGISKVVVKQNGVNHEIDIDDILDIQ